MQRFDLDRKIFNNEVKLITDSSIQLLQANRVSTMVLERNQRVNVTCMTRISCNDYHYDIEFMTNTSDAYRIDSYSPDRSKCSLSFNEQFELSKSLIVERAQSNASRIQCQVKFGDDFSKASEEFFYIISRNHSSYSLVFSSFFSLRSVFIYIYFLLHNNNIK